MKFWQAVAFLETEQLLEVAQAADRLGFDSITVSDHVFAPKDRKSKYPYTPTGEPLWSAETPWPDPWVLIAAMSAVTTRLKFSTNVYIAPGRDLFTVAKLVSSAAVISGGRVSLGTAAGWCQEEFELAGQDFHNRGKRLNEMMRGAAAALARRIPGIPRHLLRFRAAADRARARFADPDLCRR